MYNSASALSHNKGYHSTRPPCSFFPECFVPLPEAYKVMNSPANGETHNPGHKGNHLLLPIPYAPFLGQRTFNHIAAFHMVQGDNTMIEQNALSIGSHTMVLTDEVF
jgi:hypothetical protein